MGFWVKAENSPILRKVEKNTFLVTKKPSFLLQFLKKLKFLREKFFLKPLYLGFPNSLLSSIPCQYTPFFEPKQSY